MLPRAHFQTNNNEFCLLQVRCTSKLFYTLSISPSRIIFFQKPSQGLRRFATMRRIFFLPHNEQIKGLIPRSVSVSKHNCPVSHSKWVFFHVHSGTVKSFFGGKKHKNVLKVNRRGHFQQSLYPGRGAPNEYFLISGSWENTDITRPLKAKIALWQLSEGHLLPFSWWLNSGGYMPRSSWVFWPISARLNFKVSKNS